MELNRNQYFFIGVVILLIGLQLRMVSTYTLTHEATKFLAQRTNASAGDHALLAVTGDIRHQPIHSGGWIVFWCPAPMSPVTASKA